MTDHQPLHRLLLLLAVVGFTLMSTAQNNPYKIDDELYAAYQRIQKVRLQPRSLLMADTMRHDAIRKHDLKAECVALTVPVNYYFNSDDYDALVASIDTLMAVSERNGYLQYYYYAWGEHVSWLINHTRTLLALQVSEEMKESAFERQHHYGIYNCYRTQGNIYLARNNDKQAMTCFEKALEYKEKYLPEQDAAPLYLQMAKTSRGMKNAESREMSVYYCDLAMRTGKTYSGRMGAALEKCGNLYEQRLYADFIHLYDSCEAVMQQKGIVQMQTVQLLRVYRLIIDQRYADALLCSDSIINLGTRYSIKRQIAEMAGDYRATYEYTMKAWHYSDSVIRQIQSLDLAEVTVQLDNQRIKQESQKLQLQNSELNLRNTRLHLQNTELELQRIKSEADMRLVNAENDSLQLMNQALELERLHMESQRQQARLQEQEAATQYRTVIFSLSLVFAVLFICLLLFYLWRKRKAEEVLRHKNEELTVARDHAEQSDRMKMHFIQNMSHEIRTPLNAIVGFSQILTMPGMEMEDDEKLEYATLIQQNSDLLTTLVNDVLDLASLESGKYTMHLSRYPINELCRMALSSVRHRVPQGVELRFTSDVPDDFQLLTDEHRLRQVLINFLTNAEKYTTEGEIHLHCSLTEHPGRLTFSVTDTGTGIPADQAEHIFERFKKLDEFKQGTGLGLNICRIIAERLHGTVCVDTSYTGGARFLFIHPLGS